MARKRFVFENIGEADAFELGLFYRWDSAITSVDQSPDPDGGVLVIVTDEDLEQDEGFDE